MLPAELTPASIEPLAESESASTVLRVRVYVGADHRARVVSWEEELTEVVNAASALLSRGSSVQLELVESVGWERAGGPLEKTLESLTANDPGTDVDVVVGLVDASETALVDFSSLVRVDSKVRHIVVRGFHWQAESAALGSGGDKLGESAKERLLIRRRKHKQAITLAHGIAALYGEPAAFGTRYEMATKAIVGDAGDRLRESVLSRLALRKEAERRKPKTAEPGALRLIDRENLAQVRLLLEAQKPGVAWEILEPLLELYPANAEIATVGCLVAEARSATDVAVRCEGAISAGSESAEAYLALARTQLAGRPKEALANLRRVEAVLPPDDAKEWGMVAQAYKTLSLATHAARAAAIASETAVATWARESKTRYAVHVGVAPDDEGAYLQALQAVLALVYKNDFAAATASAKTLTKNYPDSVASEFVQCELSMHKRKYDEALRACRAVVAKHPKNSWTRYLQGVAHARQSRNDDAVRMLQEAIDRDSTLEPAYKALGQLYRKGRDTRLAALRKTYKEIFNKTL